MDWPEMNGRPGHAKHIEKMYFVANIPGFRRSVPDNENVCENFLENVGKNIRENV
jgi:hypothetical protein